MTHEWHFISWNVGHELFEFNTDIMVGGDSWWSDYNLLIDMCYLFESPKVALNSSKLCKSGNNVFNKCLKVVLKWNLVFQQRHKPH